MFDRILDILAAWWMIPLFTSLAGLLVPWKFQRIISQEMERGGEEFGERVVARIQKWVVLFMVLSAVILIAMLGYWLAFEVFGLTFN